MTMKKGISKNSVKDCLSNNYANRRHKMRNMLSKNIKTVLLSNLPLWLFLIILITASCTTIDCPLNSLVYTQYKLMNAEGKADTLTDTLTISTVKTDGTDSILINKNINTTEIALPISYSLPQDVFYFETKDTLTGTATIDTITVTKTDRPHFESVDCSPLYFHTITAVSTTHNAIDSAKIINSDVSYDTSKKHIYIYFKHRH